MRHSCIRSTCSNAIVHTGGNNWTIYELRGLALRMYDYRGKRCVARTTGEPVVTHLPPFPSNHHHHGRRSPSSLFTTCNYSHGRCISIPRLIVKIALGIQQKDNIEGKQWRYNSRDPSRASSRVTFIVIHTNISV